MSKMARCIHIAHVLLKQSQKLVNLITLKYRFIALLHLRAACYFHVKCFCEIYAKVFLNDYSLEKVINHWSR